MEWGVLFFVLLGLLLGGIVLQATLAARHWRRVIEAGDVDALREAVDTAFESWRRLKPPRGFPAADWQGLQSAAIVAFDHDRCRVSLLAGPDVRVVGRERREVGSALDVARRVAVRMTERLLYEIPHVRFGEVQVDVHASYRDSSGEVQTECLLTTRVDRAAATAAPWDEADPAEILRDWVTREAMPGAPLDANERALIEPGAAAAIAEAEATLRRASQ